MEDDFWDWCNWTDNLAVIDEENCAVDNDNYAYDDTDDFWY